MSWTLQERLKVNKSRSGLKRKFMTDKQDSIFKDVEIEIQGQHVQRTVVLLESDNLSKKQL